ncbi:MAG: hypothetical protein ACI8YQ_003476 [Polaribacter sp.]|jgi:hypothetical protein
MKNIIPCGAFFPKSASGYLLNPCSHQLVDQRYLPMLKEIIKAYIDQEGAKLHSVYLRGSVPRGMAMGTCDLDTFALIFTETDRWRKPEWADGVQEVLKKEYPFVSETELIVASYGPVLRSQSKESDTTSANTNPNLAMMIKTQSICLYGNDISPKLPMYRPDVSMMLSYLWLADDLKDFNENKKDETKQRDVRRVILKTLIRSGFELVMSRIQQYTPDLYLCYRSFADFYPKEGEWMRQILEAYLNVEEVEVKEVDGMVNELGSWMIAEFKRSM